MDKRGRGFVFGIFLLFVGVAFFSYLVLSAEENTKGILEGFGYGGFEIVGFKVNNYNFEQSQYESAPFSFNSMYQEKYDKIKQMISLTNKQDLDLKINVSIIIKINYSEIRWNGTRYKLTSDPIKMASGHDEFGITIYPNIFFDDIYNKRINYRDISKLGGYALAYQNGKDYIIELKIDNLNLNNFENYLIDPEYINKTDGIKLNGSVGVLYNAVTTNGTDFWVTEYSPTLGGKIYHINLAGEVINSFLLHLESVQNPNILGLTFDSSDNTLWQADRNNDGRLAHFNLAGDNLANISNIPSIGTSNDPWAVAYDPTDDTFWLTDNTDKFVYHFDQNTNNQSDGFKFDNSGISNAMGIAYDFSDDSFWIVDNTDMGLYHLSSTGINQTGGTDLTLFGMSSPRTVTVSLVDDSLWIYDFPDDFIYHISFEDTISPETSKPNITPQNPTTSNNLQCNATLTDDFRTNLTAFWRWYKDGVVNLSGNTSVKNGNYSLITTLDAGNLTPGQNWICEVKPFDEYNYGNADNSTIVTVLATIMFNVTNGEDGSQISNFNINCNNSFSDAGVSSPYTTEFSLGNYECLFIRAGFYNNTRIFIVDNDTTINVKLSKQLSLTIEEHTWLEGIYNCVVLGDCNLYNLLLEMNQTIGKIWEQTKPTNNSVIIFENITNKVVDSTHNLTIDYIVNIPIKPGYSLGDYLPIRIGFWFLNTSNTTCYNQGDKPTGVEEPYCQPLIIETFGPMGGQVNFTVELQPNLLAGDYSIKRIIDIDPNNVWINYGQETISLITLTENINHYGIDIKKTGEIIPEREGILQNIQSGITGAVTGFNQLISGWQIVFIITMLGITFIVFIIVRYKTIKLKK